MFFSLLVGGLLIYMLGDRYHLPEVSHIHHKLTSNQISISSINTQTCYLHLRRVTLLELQEDCYVWHTALIELAAVLPLLLVINLIRALIILREHTDLTYGLK